MLFVPAEEFRWYTRLTPAECEARLSKAMDPEWTWRSPMRGLTGTGTVIGRVADGTLRLRRRIQYRNSFQPVLTATIRSEPGGASIEGRIAMHGSVRVFLVLWFLILVLVGVPLVLKGLQVMSAAEGSDDPNWWFNLVIPPAMALFAFGIARFGRFLAREEPALLKSFLATTIEAHPGVE